LKSLNVLSKTNIVPTLAVEPMQLHLEVVEVHSSDTRQNLLFQGFITFCFRVSGIHNLFGNRVPTILHKLLFVDVGTEELGVVSE
jgi:hypothetical protein